MKIRTVSNLIFVVFFVGVVGAGAFSLLSPLLKLSEPATTTVADASFGWKFPVAKFPLTGLNPNLIAYSSIRDPGGTPQGLPVRLKIPAIGVDSAIEDALITPDGRMDVPAGSVNVAWFSLGPHPGQVGSAVIGGHFGISNGIPFVFYNLNKVTIGEKIYIDDDSGNTLAFVVRSIKSFDRNADSTPVFLSSDGIAHLNLITCEGVWNQVNGNYPQRLVIFTDAIPSEGAITVNKPKPVVKPVATKKPSLPATAIVTPIPSPSVSPSPLPELSPALIATPSAQTTLLAMLRQNMYSVPANFAPYVTSLFNTPLDAGVSSLLLLSIGLVIYKIIRR